MENRLTNAKVIGVIALFLLSAGFSRSQDPDAEDTAPRIMLYSLFSWGGMSGNVTFAHTLKGGRNVTLVEMALELTDPEEGEVTWAIHEWPVKYDNTDRCSGLSIGPRLIDLTAEVGAIATPITGALVFETDKLPILGPDSIWSRSLVIKGKKGSSCSNIHGVGGEHTYEARFHIPLGGSIWLRSWNWELPVVSANGSSKGTQTVMYSDVFNTLDGEPKSSDHDWILYITDILDSRDYGVSCKHLTTVYDVTGKSHCDEQGCPEGRLGSRYGPLRVGAKRSRFSRKLYSTSELNIPDLSGPTDLYIGVMDVTHSDHVWGCGKIRQIKVKNIDALFNHQGVRGKISLQQPSVFAPTDLSLYLNGLKGRAKSFQVHQMPFTAPQSKDHNVCDDTLALYNPNKVPEEETQEAGVDTHDKYALGDLSGKHGQLTNVDNLDAVVTDFNLPVFGPLSVVGRSIVIKNEDGTKWICGNLRNTKPVVRAVVVFRYPIVGEILMEQVEEDPHEDTTVFVGPLVYSDGNHNTTGDHEFRIHLDPPGRDYFNWTGRCLSAGRRYNPYHVSVEEKVYKDCSSKMPERCELGDLVGRLGSLDLAGTIQRADSTRKVVTDTHLPLQGKYSIIGHSMVINDKHAPKHRGDRMACATISVRFRHKGVVSDWFSKKGEGDLTGKIEFIQETPYDITNTEVELQGLEGLAQNYSIHLAQVEHELEFPCTDSAIYGRYNPLEVVGDRSPPPGEGTHDRYLVGDLSGKYGTLEGAHDTEGLYNDTNLPLFGHTSVMGRSLVIYRGDYRWFCGNIGWGYSPAEATQVSAIASFHHPKGYAWGYIKFRQLIYRDGSFGETFMEVSLKHPGPNNRNVTKGHNWSIYVNPVGVDASVKFYQSRCVASGYRWNPYLIHLAQPNAVEFYDKECTPKFPLRCEVGDLSGRHGPLVIGEKKQVFVDSNLPLSGEQSAMNRAIIIHNEQGRVERYACANILPDDDIIKWANVKKTTNFSPTFFMKNMRKILGSPDWFVLLDVNSVSESADGECVTFLLHFTGPYARQLELDFTRLLSGGILHSPTIKIFGLPPDEKRKNKVSYRSCGGLDEEEIARKNQRKWWTVFTSISGSPAVGDSPWKLIALTAVAVILNVFHNF